MLVLRDQVVEPLQYLALLLRERVGRRRRARRLGLLRPPLAFSLGRPVPAVTLCLGQPVPAVALSVVGRRPLVALLLTDLRP
ncbi:hypothetical protein [Nannocystis pusilla]|uniref:hypothetical protein n=1 Tax=Nannocystis pusilla TaxID=889268 RepID=UPI003B7C5CA1